MDMTGPAQVLSNPFVGLVLRVALGSYVIYMARNLYSNPASYLQKSAQWVLDYPWVRHLLRGLACFCLWGGCFILATVVAVQVVSVRGNELAVALIVLSAVAAWLLLPRNFAPRPEGGSGFGSSQRPN
jgi:hypothetical protein